MGQLTTSSSAKMKELKLQDSPQTTRTGVSFPRYFTARLDHGKTPYDEIQWDYCLKRLLLLERRFSRHLGRAWFSTGSLQEL